MLPLVMVTMLFGGLFMVLCLVMGLMRVMVRMGFLGLFLNSCLGSICWSLNFLCFNLCGIYWFIEDRFDNSLNCSLEGRLSCVCWWLVILRCRLSIVSWSILNCRMSIVSWSILNSRLSIVSWSSLNSGLCSIYRGFSLLSCNICGVCWFWCLLFLLILLS